MESSKIQRKENADHEQSLINSSLMQQPANNNSAQPAEAQMPENLEPQHAHNFADISIFAPEHTVQRKAAPKTTTDATEPDLNSRIQASVGNGSPLESTIQTQLETGIGADLSGVRVHTDSQANKLSHELHANAFTTGNDIYFRQGLYNPTSSDGMRLLAHEATHTVQQANGAVDGVSWGGGVKVSDPNDRFEQAAEATANNFMNSSPIGVAPTGGSSSAGVVQREAVIEEEKDKLEKPEEEKELQLERDSSGLSTFIQRDPTPAAATSPASATPTSAPMVWKPPFDLPQASKKYEAGIRLLMISQQLDDLQESMGDLDQSQIEGANKGIKSLFEPMRSEDALTRDDVNQLEIASGFAKRAVDSGRKAISEIISAALTKISVVDTSDMDKQQANLDDEMQTAFLAKDIGRISKIKATLSVIEKYKKQADEVADWATKLNGILRNVPLKEFLDNFGKRSKQLKSGMSKVGQLLDVAKLFDGLTSDQNATQSMNDIGNFENAIKVIDIGMGFFKCIPLVGDLWSKYYKPLTETCIKLLKKISRLEDIKARELTFSSWKIDNYEPRGSNGVPVIPKPLEGSFPGGQNVLNYMYPLVNGGSPQMTPEVEKYFIENKERFNAGEDSKNSFDSEWHIIGPKTSSNLISWISKNTNTVWAMLYGSMDKMLPAR